MTVSAKHTTSALLIAAALLASCSTGPVESADVVESIRTTIQRAGLKDVTVKQDRTKGVVTLGGRVVNESDKAQAEALARPLAAGQVVALEIAVVPVGAEADAKSINSDVDGGIEKNLSAALTS